MHQSHSPYPEPILGLSAFLLSLIVASILSFTAPVLVVAALFALALGIEHLPGLTTIGQMGVDQVLRFLATFGDRDPWEGMLVIGLTCGFVGALFDTYSFYRHQNLRNH